VDNDSIELLLGHGWRVIDAYPFGKDMMPFRDYILRSDGEFTVAKDQYVRMRTGWFSDRSAYYLAAGKPVITQDTGFGKFLPTGEGLFGFNTMDDIVAAFEAIRSDYARHSRAARAVAEECFRAETVLAKLIDDLDLQP
jgi:glycosyltransferase involved in cell wall biosynthesis